MHIYRNFIISLKNDQKIVLTIFKQRKIRVSRNIL